MLQQLVISSIRVWLFSSPVLEIPITDLNKFLPIYSKTCSWNSIVNRIFLTAYCSSNWTKATLYLEANQIMGWIHLIMGSILLQSLNSRKKSIRFYPFRFKKILFNSIVYSIIGFVLDELITNVVLLLKEKKRTVRGIVAKGDCIICLTETQEQVESFCASNHTCHSSCLSQWYKPFGIYKLCPYCRQEMIVQLSTKYHFGWFNAYKKGIIKRLKIHSLAYLLMLLVHVMSSIVLKKRIQYQSYSLLQKNM